MGALPSRRSHERVAEAARSSVGAGFARWLSPPQPSRALAEGGVLFSSSLLCLLRSSGSASGKHAAAAGKTPRATVVDPSPNAATTRAYDSGKFGESTSCHGVRVLMSARAHGGRAARARTQRRAPQRAFGRRLATCTPIGSTHGPFRHMRARRAAISSRGAHARRNRAVDGEVQFTGRCVVELFGWATRRRRIEVRACSGNRASMAQDREFAYSRAPPRAST